MDDIKIGNFGDSSEEQLRQRAESLPLPNYASGMRHKIPCNSYKEMICATPAWCYQSGCKVAQCVRKPMFPESVKAFFEDSKP